MKKSKKAFTMVEIIFVIVIIATLAAVAIPRLMASREDAKIAVSLAEMGMVVSDLSSYYTSTGQFNADVSEMSNVLSLTYTTAWNPLTQEGVLTYNTSDVNNAPEACVRLSVKNKEGNLSISNVAGVNTVVCQRLQGHQTYQKLLGTRLLNGNQIQF